MALRDLSQTSRLFYENAEVWVGEKDKARRAARTTTFVNELITTFFGDLTGFFQALAEAEFAEFHARLEQEHQRVLLQFRAECRVKSRTLMIKAKLSRKQWTTIRTELCFRNVHILPCYETISRYWRKQGGLKDVIGNDSFFEMLESGERVLLSQTGSAEAPVFRVTILNLLRWILFIVESYMGYIIKQWCVPDNDVNVHFDFLLWGDGGQLWGLKNGLFSAIKGVDISVRCANHQMCIPPHWFEYFVNRIWTLSVRRKAENATNCGEMVVDEMEQWNSVIKEEIRYHEFVLLPRLLGGLSDHGYRYKLFSKDSADDRCGECDGAFSTELNEAKPYYFLDWEYILSLQEVTLQNWNSTRFTPLPEHLTMTDFTFLTYDNLHLKALFGVMRRKLSHKDLCIVEQSMSKLTGVPIQPQTTNSKGKKSKKKWVWDSFRCYQWRLCSLHFYDIFKFAFGNKEIDAAFRSLIDLLTEIQIFNYVNLHFRTDSDDHRVLLCRYALLLYLYTEQLRVIFSSKDLSPANDIYLHKLLGHSLILFKSFSLSTSSCEPGEGGISVVNRNLRVCSGQEKHYQRKLFLHMATEQEDTAKSLMQLDQSGKRKKRRPSPVFRKSFWKNYCVREISYRLPKHAALNDCKIVTFLCTVLNVSPQDLVRLGLLDATLLDESRIVPPVHSSNARNIWISFETADVFNKALRRATHDYSSDQSCDEFLERPLSPSFMVCPINSKHYQYNPFCDDGSEPESDEDLLPVLQETVLELKSDIAVHNKCIQDMLLKLDSTLHAHYQKLGQLLSVGRSAKNQVLDLDAPFFDSIFVVDEEADCPLLPIDAMNNKQLKRTLRECGLSAEGNQPQLRVRLREHTTTRIECTGPDTSPIHYDRDEDDTETPEETTKIIPNEKHNLALLLCHYCCTKITFRHPENPLPELGNELSRMKLRNNGTTR